MITSPSSRMESAPADFFSRIDTDSDGQLTADELQADFETHIQQAESGTNARPAPDFAQMLADGDTDADGTLSEVEFTTAMQARHHRPAPPPTESSASTSLDEAIAQLDTSGDSKLSADELQAAFLSRHLDRADETTETIATTGDTPDFESLVSLVDTDGDGLLTTDELATLVTDARRSGQPPPPPMDPRHAPWDRGEEESTSRTIGQG